MGKEHAYIEIGKGTFGIIFQDASATQIVKRTLKPNIDPRQWLNQDAKWHDRIATSLKALSEVLGMKTTRVPGFFGLTEIPDHGVLPWLDASATVEDSEYRKIKSLVLQAQRIPVVSKSIRKSILQRVVRLDEKTITCALEAAQNQNCLLRTYFGKVEQERERRVRLAPSLRNFSLGRTKLMACLSADDYSNLLKMLARTMACLHWYIGCDARDVEFVLGGTIGLEEDTETFLVLGEAVTAWLLDFNQVTEITMDADGAEKAADAFLDNDSYFPKSNRDVDDWSTFRSEYLAASQKVQIHKTSTQNITPKDEYFALPTLFCDIVEKRLDQI